MILNDLQTEIKGMIQHWLTTPVNGYYGLTYGAPLNELLLHAHSQPVVENFINKMKVDIPILQNLDSNQLAIYERNNGIEEKQIILAFGTDLINLTNYGK